VTVAQLLEAAQEAELEPAAQEKREKDRQARRLGTMLRQLRGRVFDLEAATVRVTKAGVDARTKQGRWRLVRLNGPQGGGGHAEHAECAECPKADAGLPAPAADGPEHIPHIPQPPAQDPPPLPPNIRHVCPRCGSETELLRIKAQCLSCLLVFVPPRIPDWATKTLDMWAKNPEQNREQNREQNPEQGRRPETANIAIPKSEGENPEQVWVGPETRTKHRTKP
jgi:hypothetical protein